MYNNCASLLAFHSNPPILAMPMYKKILPLVKEIGDLRSLLIWLVKNKLIVYLLWTDMIVS